MITRFQKVIHRHGRWIFLLLLAVILVAFLLWDYAGIQMRSQGLMPTRPWVIYGRKIPPKEVEISKRLFALNLEMMTGRPLQMDARGQKMLEEQSLGRMATVEKARQMGLTVADEETIADVRQFFTRNNEYRQESYEYFLREVLGPRSLSEGHFERLIQENILLRKLLGMIASTAKVTPQHARIFASEVLEKITASACRFETTNYLAQIKLSEEQVSAFYNEHHDRFRTPEKVKASYVAFPIEAAKAKVSDQEMQQAYDANQNMFRKPDGSLKPMKEVADILRYSITQQRTVRQATEFTIKLVPEEGKEPPTFDRLARDNGLEIKQTGFFAENELAPGISTPDFTYAAFKLTRENPVSDPISSQNAVYVLHFLEEPQASFVPPYESVKAAVKSACAEDLALKLARENGRKKRDEFIAMLGQGKTADQAWGLLKLKPQRPKPFSGDEELPSDPFENTLRRAAFQLPEGAVSDFIQTAEGGFFLHLALRQQAKPEEISKIEPRIFQTILQIQQRQLVEDFRKSVLEEALPKSEAPPPSEPEL
ncbi:MAG: peptidyl-prolyl cis-trans isomerase [Verrucomicrobia bacterium]|nr:peptidyl-prolyl cis-trans isomerase [Verrucomicrobiota bacterium]